jgi:hypothetical protein
MFSRRLVAASNLAPSLPVCPLVCALTTYTTACRGLQWTLLVFATQQWRARTTSMTPLFPARSSSYTAAVGSPGTLATSSSTSRFFSQICRVIETNLSKQGSRPRCPTRCRRGRVTTCAGSLLWLHTMAVSASLFYGPSSASPHVWPTPITTKCQSNYRSGSHDAFTIYDSRTCSSGVTTGS